MLERDEHLPKLIVRLSQASSSVETAKTINCCIDQPEASYLYVDLAENAFSAFSTSISHGTPYAVDRDRM